MDADHVYFNGDTQNCFILVDHKKFLRLRSFFDNKCQEFSKRVEKKYQTSEAKSQDARINRLFYENELGFLLEIKRSDPKNFVRMLEYSVNGDGLAVISLQYVQGVPLNTILYAPIYGYTASTIVDYCKQLFTALVFMHERGYVHGNIKAMSFRVSVDGILKLTNFKTTMLKDKHFEATLISTYLPYCAPEILGSEFTMSPMFDDKFDVFSAGILLWEMVMRKPLHIDEIFLKAHADDKRIPDLPCRREFSEIFDYCTAWSPVDRCSSEAALDYFRSLEKRGTFAEYDVQPSIDWSQTRLQIPDGVLPVDDEDVSSIKLPLAISTTEFFGDGHSTNGQINESSSTPTNHDRDLYCFWTRSSARVFIGLPSFFDGLEYVTLEDLPIRASTEPPTPVSYPTDIEPGIPSHLRDLDAPVRPPRRQDKRRTAVLQPSTSKTPMLVDEFDLLLGEGSGREFKARLDNLREEEDRLLFGGGLRFSQQAQENAHHGRSRQRKL